INCSYIVQSYFVVCFNFLQFFPRKIDNTPGDHSFFLGKNWFGNTSCVSNMFFLKKNEKFHSKKNTIKMNHFIPIFSYRKWYIFPLIFLWEKYQIFLQGKILGKMLHFYVKK